MSDVVENRPWMVQAFEVLSVLVEAFGLIFARNSWFDFVFAALFLWGVLSVTRKKSGVARLLLSGVYGVGCLIMIALFASGKLGPQDLKWTAWVLSVANVAQMVLLWSPQTSDWLLSKRRTEVYFQTFS